jgi:hypothetical protein
VLVSYVVAFYGAAIVNKANQKLICLKGRYGKNHILYASFMSSLFGMEALMIDALDIRA